MQDNLIHAALSQSIIGAAMTVLNALKPGYDEKLYETLVIELLHPGHRIDQQSQFPVVYRKQLVGILVPDLLVDELIIVDTKVVECFIDARISKMLGYLAKTDLNLALLINFKFASLKWKRVVRQLGST